MKNSKNTRRALVLSVLSVVMCLAMLIGTTFAWFTDTASTSVSTIQAGTLNVEIQGANNESIEKLNWVKAEGHADEAILWEPGCTYNLESFKIVNTGNLALKYKIVVTDATGDKKLLDVIHFTYTADGQDLDISQEGHLAAGDETGLITVSAHMDESAGNEYQGLKLEGVAIKVYATQDTVEYDSDSNQYDQNATLNFEDVSTGADAVKAAAEGKSLVVKSDLIPEKTIKVLGTGSNVIIDAAGHVIANGDGLWDESTGSWSLVSIENGASATITGNGTFEAKENDCYAVDVQDGSKLVIENGTFIGNIHAVYVEKGELVVNGGFFSVQQKYPDAAKADGFVLNCLDENHANGTAKITVTGGTFVNFNPADCWAEGAHTNFVADGYKVVSEAHGSDTWYIVVPE